MTALSIRVQPRSSREFMDCDRISQPAMTLTIAFKTQDQRSHGRIDAALADDLKRVGDAVAADAGVKEGGSSGFHGVQRGRFEGHHQNQPQKTADKN